MNERNWIEHLCHYVESGALVILEYWTLCFFPPLLGQALQSMGTPLVPQQSVQKQEGKKAFVPATWSDSSVNISLDYLGPGMQPPKPTQPTLSMMQQQQHGIDSTLHKHTASHISLWLSMVQSSSRYPVNHTCLKCYSLKTLISCLNDVMWSTVSSFDHHHWHCLCCSYFYSLACPIQILSVMLNNASNTTETPAVSIWSV